MFGITANTKRKKVSGEIKTEDDKVSPLTQAALSQRSVLLIQSPLEGFTDVSDMF